MYRISTKADRLAIRQAEFDRMIEKGYDQDSYKSLTWFIKDEGGKYYLRMFNGTSSKDFFFKYCGSAERRNQIIEEQKKYADRAEAYKAEQKAKGGATSSHASAAKMLKAELSKAFPGIKFSVTSSSYSGGDSLRVHYEDGPSPRIVEEISGKYQAGHFDGMTDMYEYSNTREDIPQTKFVFVERKMSKETRATIDAAYLEKFGVANDDYGDRTAHRLFQKCSFPAGAKITGIGNTGETCGLWEDIYTITYEGGNQVQTKVEPAAAAPSDEPIEAKPGEIHVVDYSEKAFAVIGDTKPIKDLLSSLYGKFNKHLSCGPGWIFSKKRLKDVEEAIRKHVEERKQKPFMQLLPATTAAEVQNEWDKTQEFLNNLSA